MPHIAGGGVGSRSTTPEDATVNDYRRDDLAEAPDVGRAEEPADRERADLGAERAAAEPEAPGQAAAQAAAQAMIGTSPAEAGGGAKRPVAAPTNAVVSTRKRPTATTGTPPAAAENPAARPESITVTQGGIETASADSVNVRQGGIGRAEAGDISVTMGGIAIG